MGTSAINLEKLSKKYRGTTAFSLDHVTLAIAPGEVYGFLGPNGAGKSTTIRCLLNFIQPTEGSATILGKDIVQDSVAIKKHVGYLAGDIALYSRMTGQECIDYLAELQPPKRPGYITSLTRAFRAELNKPIEQLSKGNRQKIGIIQAFMHEPEVLILDEPTSGLDPLMQEAFYTVVRDAKARGATVFFSSHNLNEVRRVCDRIGFIKDGKLINEQRLDELANTAAHTFDITFAGAAPMDKLKHLKNATITGSPDPRHVTVRVQGVLTPFFALLARNPVSQIDQRDVDLEQEFMQLYRDDDGDTDSNDSEEKT
jgi:ABC-2 type transport system ATP-binding protein